MWSTKPRSNLEIFEQKGGPATSKTDVFDTTGFLGVVIVMAVVYLLTPRPGLYKTMALWFFDLLNTSRILLGW